MAVPSPIPPAFGPQYPGDNAFTKIARLLQSQYRADVLGETAWGIGPNKNSVYSTGGKMPAYYGNMLVNGEITGKNFLLRETFEYAKERVRNKKKEETIGEYRLFNNMLSSMPMAFNLFHPLMLLLEKHPDVLHKMLHDAFPSLHIKKVRDIKIEFIPTPIENYTNDKSAMDAAILFEDLDGAENLIAIETKYTDSLGTNKAADNDPKYQTALDLQQFTKEGLGIIQNGSQQIFRNYLLAEKFRLVHHLKHSYSIILAPEAHPTTEKEIAVLKAALKDDFKNKIQKKSLECFVNKLQDHCPAEFQGWLGEFRDRYWGFEKVEQYFLPNMFKKYKSHGMRLCD